MMFRLSFEVYYSAITCLFMLTIFDLALRMFPIWSSSSSSALGVVGSLGNTPEFLPDLTASRFLLD